MVPGEGVVAGDREDGLAGAGSAALLRGRQAPPGEFVDPPGPRLPFDSIPPGPIGQDTVHAKSSCGPVQSSSGGMAPAKEKPSTGPVSSGLPVTGEAIEEAA